MAVLTTKLTLTKGSTTESVSSYSVQNEGTVKTASGGSYWQINNNGTTAYIGLWPTSVTSGGNPNHSMLKITKSGTEYWVEKTVNNNVTLILSSTSHQTITLKYTQPGASEVTKTSTSSNQSFTVEAGTTWTATIEADAGYSPGTLSPGSSGTIVTSTTISASAATEKEHTPFSLYYYAQNNISNYSNIQYLPSLNKEELSYIKVSSNASNAFYGCENLTTLEGIETTWDTSEVTSMWGMFNSCYKLTTIQLNNWNVSNVEYFTDMFFGCKKLTNLNLTNWNTSSAKSMQSMFFNCFSLTSLDLSSFNTTNVESMKNMFSVNLSSSNGIQILDLTNFNTANTTNMEYMFHGTVDSCKLQYIIIRSTTFKFEMKDSNCGNLGSSCKILVPNSLLNTYKTATNWSSRASQFDKIEDYNITRSNGTITVTHK